MLKKKVNKTSQKAVCLEGAYFLQPNTIFHPFGLQRQYLVGMIGDFYWSLILICLLPIL